MQGRLIVFEGVEGSGKSTQIRRLKTWLSQTQLIPHPFTAIQQTHEPGGTELGSEIRQLLLHKSGDEPIHYLTELLLYAADRAQHIEVSITPLLKQGSLVLCDRFTDSTLAYQGYGRGLDLALIQQLNEIATRGLTSDLTFWLDLPVEVGLARTRQRGSLDRMEQTDLSFHQRVQQGYAALALAHPQRIVRIDASLSETEVAKQIQSVIQPKLEAWVAP